jgi:hypothetical protein
MEAPEKLIAQYSRGSIGLDQLVMGLERVRRAFSAVSNALFLGELGRTLREIGVEKNDQVLILSTVRTRLKNSDGLELTRGLAALLFSLGSYLLVAPESWPGGNLSSDGWAAATVLVGALGWAIGLSALGYYQWKLRGWSPSTLAHAFESGAILGLAVLLVLATR